MLSAKGRDSVGCVRSPALHVSIRPNFDDSLTTQRSHTSTFSITPKRFADSPEERNRNEQFNARIARWVVPAQPGPAQGTANDLYSDLEAVER